MNTYQLLTAGHVTCTLAAFVCGAVAIVVRPKGGELHRKSGRLYTYSYLGVLLTAFAMLLLQFKFFFCALTLFGSYLLLAGNHYARQQGQGAKRNGWIFSLLLLTSLVYLTDVFFVLNNLAGIGPGWSVVRLSFALIAFGTLALELRGPRNRRRLHASLMLLSFIPLLNGLLARLAPTELIWLSWIAGYLIGIPLMAWWFRRSKTLQEDLG
jgi:uncharacterized membrane protein